MKIVDTVEERMEAVEWLKRIRMDMDIDIMKGVDLERDDLIYDAQRRIHALNIALRALDEVLGKKGE